METSVSLSLRNARLILPMLVFTFLFSGTSFSQNVAITDVDGYNPNASAMLDVNSTSRGFLLPRVTAAQMTAIASPAVGLMVFNTDQNAIYYYTGSAWVNLLSLGVSILRASDGVPAQALTVDANGQIGIGTSSPSSLLHLRNIATGADSHIRLDYNGTDYGNIYYDAQGMKFRTRTASDNFWFQNSAGTNNMVIEDDGSVGIGVTSSNAKLEVKGDASIPTDSALFSVKNKTGQLVFAVYEEGVRVNVPDAPGKGGKAGFVVGGRTPGKGATVDYMLVTPDSVRIWVDDPLAKGGKGGFAVGGRTPTKLAPTNFMRLTPQNYFIGHESGLTTTGLYNAFLGYQAGKANTNGANNVFIGYQSGSKNKVGLNNVFLGYQSGYNNDASFNVFVGNSSGYLNTSGTYNAFFGYNAGANNTSGSYNAFFGNEAGYNNSYGQWNTLVGYRAGYSNIGANYITAVGFEAGYSLTDWQAGVYVGYRAGKFNTGRTNVFLGTNAGAYVSTGEDNVFVGGGAGGDYDDAVTRSTGSRNVFIGKYAGFRYMTGNNNIYIGPSAGSGATGSSNIFIGYSAGQNSTASNALIIDNAGGDVNSAMMYGDFSANDLRFNANIGINVAPSANMLYARDVSTYSDVPAILAEHNITTNYGVGIRGTGGYYGVQGFANGVAGYGTGVYGNGGYIGVYGSGATYAGYFAGNVYVSGTLSKAAGSFIIDHPLDPENKTLSHSFVESPDMKNIYDGVVLLDASGKALVQLPQYFDVLNRDFRYQLTPVGASMPGLFVSREVSNNSFELAGGVPGAKVSWQVTGIRNDPYAKKHPIIVEQNKSSDEQGKYLNPDAYGLPESKGVNANMIDNIRK